MAGMSLSDHPSADMVTVAMEFVCDGRNMYPVFCSAGVCTWRYLEYYVINSLVTKHDGPFVKNE